MSALPKKIVKHSDTTETELMHIPVQERNSVWKRKLTLQQSLEQRSQRLTVQVKCYQVDLVVCFPKVTSSPSTHLFLRSRFMKTSNGFCELWRCAKEFLYRCKWHRLSAVSGRCVKLPFTRGIHGQLLGTMLHDYAGKHPPHSKNLHRAPRKG